MPRPRRPASGRRQGIVSEPRHREHMPPDIEVLLLRLVGGDVTAPGEILEWASTNDSPALLVAAALATDRPGGRAGFLARAASTPPRPGTDSLSPSPARTWGTTRTCSTPWSATTCPITPTTSSQPGSPHRARASTNRTHERNDDMITTPSMDHDERPVQASSTSITQTLARVSAVHPWRVLIAWG